ncbi:hypothetical protein F5Y06DRAFT_110499 [Hypoxylon sp. FL0890]|nr:hypothetical protein F5Y06DRAFT_110499 [Hypoxylon sp. FL0890]
MNRSETYRPTVTTPLLIDSHGEPTVPKAGADTNGSTGHSAAAVFSRSNGIPNTTTKPAPSVDKIAIHSKECLTPYPVDGNHRRKWRVAVEVNGNQERTTDLVDPFAVDEYYKNDNDRIQRGKLQILDKSLAQTYFNQLFDQLGLSCCQKREARIVIHEDVTKISESSHFPSIHSLLWEVLEHPDFWPCSNSGEIPVKRVRLSRTLNVFNTGSTAVAIDRRASSLAATQAEYRVLLVIARSFKKDFDQKYVDYRPNLIQGPLLNIARRTKEKGITPKLHIDVVRPGTVEELDEYLKPSHGKSYDIVHFDLHGKIGPVKPPTRSWAVGCSRPAGLEDEISPKRQSYLRFARPYDPELLRFKRRDNPIEMLLTDDTSLHDVPVKRIAEKLQRSRISKVALSACLSSYAQSQIFLNMCHTFLVHDVAHVSAMSFQITEGAAQVYYRAFYESLIFRGEEFHVAAAQGRDALRASKPDGLYVLPTNYHRYPRSFSNKWWRKPSANSTRLPMLAVYLARYGVIFCFTALCLTYLWLQPLFLSMLVPIALIVIAMVWALTKRWLVILTPITEQIREQQREKSNLHSGQSTFEVDIEHLVIEDRLKSEANQGALYVWSTDYSKELSDCVYELAQTWVLTGFVDEVDIISAKVFSWALTSLASWRWLRTHRYRSDRVGTVGRRRLLVVKEFDRFYPKHPRDEDFEDLHAALTRMVSFIEGYDSEETYLIITGSYDEEWWTDANRYNDERIVNTIARAVPHNHNITPARRHVPRWSLPAMRRRWSAIWNEIV